MSWEEQVQLFLFTNISRGRSFRSKHVEEGAAIIRQPAQVPQERRVCLPSFYPGAGGGEVGAGKGRGEKKVREGRVLYKAFSE